MPFTTEEMNSMASSIWKMLGNDGLEPVISVNKNDVSVSPRRHEWVVPVISVLNHRTMLGHDLPSLMAEVAPYGHASNVPNLIAYVTACATNIRHEPRWHMERRGDTKRLDDTAWSWLRDVYSDKVEPKHFSDEPKETRCARRESIGYARVLAQAYEQSKRRQETTASEYDAFGNGIGVAPAGKRKACHERGMDGL